MGGEVEWVGFGDCGDLAIVVVVVVVMELVK